MTEDDIRKVQESFALLRGNADEAGMLFYGRLFATHPELRGLFADDIAPQAKKLMQMLALVVNGLDRLEPLLPAIDALARKHVSYGVKCEDYAVVGETLLWTLEQGLGAAFTEDVTLAWSAAYSALSGLMIEAGSSAAKPMMA